MRHETGLHKLNDDAVVLAYRQALLDGANLKAKAIREANPDLSDRFEAADRED